MKTSLKLFFLFLVLSGPLPSAFAKIPVQVAIKRSPEALKLDRVWVIEPDEENPAQVRILLEPQIELEGIRFDKPKNKPVVISFNRIDVKLTVHVRPSSAAKNLNDSIYCQAKADPLFYTTEGISLYEEKLLKGWQNLLVFEATALEKKLKLIRATSDKEAAVKVREAFDGYKTRVSDRYLKEVVSHARTEELKFYHSKSHAKTCLQLENSVLSIDEKKVIAETVEPEARSPARRERGLPTVRLSADFLGLGLNGVFAVDFSADRSLVSKGWLERQGVNPTFVETPDDPEFFHWHKGRTVGRPLFVENVELSGLHLNIDRFWMTDTLLFQAPEVAKDCCDGVIGRDVLRQYVIEWQNEAIPHFVLWPRDTFVTPVGMRSFPIHIDSNGKITAVCQADGHTTRVTFQSLKEHDFSAPKAKSKRVNLVCGDVLLLKQQSIYQAPEIEIGMSVLDRVPFYIDIPHGRMIFTQNPGDQLPLTDVVGLHTEFDFEGAARVLVVKKITAHPLAQELKTQGLREGVQIVKINGNPAEKMDAPEVLRYLSGRVSKKLQIEWRKSVEDISPLRSVSITLQ